MKVAEEVIGSARNGAIAGFPIGYIASGGGDHGQWPKVLFDALFYFLAAIGIWQLSFPAAGMAFLLHFLYAALLMTGLAKMGARLA